MIPLTPKATTIGSKISIGRLVVSRTIDTSLSKTVEAITQGSAISEDTSVLAGSLASKSAFLIPLWFATRLRFLWLQFTMLPMRPYLSFLFPQVTLLHPLPSWSPIAAISRFAVKDPDAMSINPGGTTGVLTTNATNKDSSVDVSNRYVPNLANRESRGAEFAMLLWMTHLMPLPSRQTILTMTGVIASCSKIAQTPPSSLLLSSLFLPFQAVAKLAITLAKTSVPSILSSLTCQSRSRTSKTSLTCWLVSSRTIPAKPRVVQLLLQEALAVQIVVPRSPASTQISPTSTR